MSVARLSFNSVAMIVLLYVISGCAMQSRPAFTEKDQRAAEIAGISGVRFWGDGSADEFGSAGPMPKPPIRSGRVIYLALSGGGSGGAFGAGILTGWTAAGTRPKFDVVSGVSTGALTAPFAFLGSSYDHVLVDLYTSGVAETLVERRPIIALLGAGLWNPAPLRRLVERYVTTDMLREIATEYSKGRRLFVVTTNLDAQRTVVWDMGAIAASGRERALELFRSVLLASASVPLMLPPVMIDATANGKRFQEMHSDGGAATQVFTAPESLLASAHVDPPLKPAKIELFIILNNAIDPEFSVVENSTFSVAGRAYSTLIKSHARATINATYGLTQRAGIRFNLAYLDEAVPYSMSDPFNTTYMRRLFAIGYEKALSSKAWKRTPPAASDPGM